MTDSMLFLSSLSFILTEKNSDLSPNKGYYHYIPFCDMNFMNKNKIPISRANTGKLLD